MFILSFIFSKTRKKRKGSYLLEALIGLVILLFIILSIVQLFTAGLQGIKAGENKNLVSNYANTVIDAYRNAPPSNPALNTNLAIPASISKPSSVNILTNTTNTYVKFFQVESYSTDEIVGIEVRVTWKEVWEPKTNRSLMLTSYIKK